MSEMPPISHPGPCALPRRAGHLTERFVDGELVLYDPERQYVHALNATAAFIWSMCDGNRDRASIAQVLAGRYPDNRGVIERDVSAAIDALLSAGLLVQ